MKLFFYAPVLILIAVILIGCGASSGNGGQNYSTQMAEATVPGSEVPDAAVPYDGLPESAVPGASTTEPFRPYEVENTINPPMDNEQEIMPVRVVAANVRLGKESIGGMTETELKGKLASVAAKTNIAPVDASYNTKSWAVRKEKAGKRLDTDKIVKVALAAGNGQIIPYSYLPVQPKISAAELKSKVQLIAKFATPFLDRSRSRIKNIRMTSSKLNRKIILPGQEFSFNNSTGRKSKKDGYEDATIIVRTPKGPEHKKAPGGGVCQVSTTLYNAVLKCGLKVTERHEHSDDVYYVPDGKDATVTFGGQDFRFINTRGNPIMLRVYVGRRSLQVKIYENTGIQAITS